MTESVYICIHVAKDTKFSVNMQPNQTIVLEIGDDIRVFFNDLSQLDKFAQVVEMGSRMLFDVQGGNDVK